MKRYFCTIVFVLLLTIVLAVPAFADEIPDKDNPYGSECKIQGYVPIRATFPDGSVEYKVGVCWGANPQDGKISLYNSDASSKLRAFLDSNNVPYGGGQYDLYSVYMHTGAGGFSMIDTSGCLKGSGKRTYYGSGDNARQMPEDQIQAAIDSGILLFNPPADVPPEGDPNAPPGWLVSMRFYPPDLEAVSIDLDKGEAVFKNNTNIKVKSDVMVTCNGGVIVAESDTFFWPYGAYRLKFEPQGSGTYVASVNQARDMHVTAFSPEMSLQQDLNPSNDIIVTQQNKSTPMSKDSVNDLIATNLEILDSNGNLVSGTVEVNKPYKVRATFTSTFNTSGYATVRFYIKREAGWMDIRETENVFVEAGSTFQRTWNWSGTTEKVILMSSIDRRWAGSDWENEKFNGTEDEVTYENNVYQKNITGTETIAGPPSTEDYGYPLYYHPVKITEEPIIEQQPVIGWKKAIFIKDDTEYRIRVRLVFPDQIDQ